MVSECCSALPFNNILNGRLGMCGRCKEWSEFYTDFWGDEQVADEKEKK